MHAGWGAGRAGNTCAIEALCAVFRSSHGSFWLPTFPSAVGASLVSVPGRGAPVSFVLMSHHTQAGTVFQMDFVCPEGKSIVDSAKALWTPRGTQCHAILLRVLVARCSHLPRRYAQGRTEPRSLLRKRNQRCTRRRIPCVPSTCRLQARRRTAHWDRLCMGVVLTACTFNACAGEWLVGSHRCALPYYNSSLVRAIQMVFQP